jgi:hypothetical protein
MRSWVEVPICCVCNLSIKKKKKENFELCQVFKCTFIFLVISRHPKTGRLMFKFDDDAMEAVWWL